MNAKRSAFTLVEILIVVVIMAVLAATIIPQFNSSTKDAQVSTALFNLQSLRSQIELYKAQHAGQPPTELLKLTVKTNADHSETGTPPFGPYLLRLPDNPFNNLDTVAAAGADPPSADGTTGWLYMASTGKVWINDTTYVTE
jgi:prepilin-type N-terminal cleavage/methylation domain-containing protein